MTAIYTEGELVETINIDNGTVALIIKEDDIELMAQHFPEDPLCPPMTKVAHVIAYRLSKDNDWCKEQIAYYERNKDLFPIEAAPEGVALQ